MKHDLIKLGNIWRETALTWKSESGHEQYSIQTNIRTPVVLYQV
jgi:hypothetical protein